jgi:hypothetical protein
MSYLGNTPTQQGFIPAIDFFSGNGSTVAFTLSRPVASVAQVQATIENVPQNPGTAFTVSGNTITFDGAPASGTNNIYVYYTSPITTVIQPGQGTVGTAQFASGVTVPFGLGSASAPSIAFTGDSNTGVFSPGADTIAFAEGGTEVARFNSSGNLGIGNIGSDARLAVTPPVNTDIANGIRLFNAGGTGGNNYGFGFFGSSGRLSYTAGDGGFHAFFTANLERMSILPSGAVITPYQPMASVYSTTQGFTGSVGTVVPFNVEQVDAGGNYNTSTYRFTAPVAGKYFATVWFLSRANSSGNCIGLAKNGTNVQGRGGYVQGGSGQENQGVQSLIIDCAANDYIDARITQYVNGDFFLLDLAGMQIYLIG